MGKSKIKEISKMIFFSFLTVSIIIFIFSLAIGQIVWLLKRRESIVRNDLFLYYTANPYFKSDTIHINKKFSRGEDFSVKKQDGRIRIVVMGDSDTFGWKLKDNQTYPYILREILNQRLGTKKYEVINFGTPGYTSLELLNLLKRHVSRYSPDMLMVMVGWNDSSSALWLSLIPYQWRKNHVFSLLNSFVNQSAAITLLKESLKKIITKKSISKCDNVNQGDAGYSSSVVLSFKDYGSLEVIKDNRVPANEYEVNLKNIIAYCRNMNILPVFITSPCGLKKSDFLNSELDRIKIEYGKSFPGVSREIYRNAMTIYDYMETVRKVAKEEQIPLIDCYAEFMTLPLKERIPLFIDIFRDLAHPNEKGNRLVAEIIARSMTNQALLKN